MSASPTLVVFSHLRWGGAFQRPQHLFARLAGRWQVLFVEEPIHDDSPVRLEAFAIDADVHVLVPHMPAAAHPWDDTQLALLEPLLAQYLQSRGLRADVVWLRTPMAAPLLHSLRPDGVVHDRSGERSACASVPPQWRARASALLAQASLVLTGGPSLYEACRSRHPNVHCVPSAVDARAFAPARVQPGSGQGALPHPRLGYRLGYFGVVDERIDLALIASIADAHPEWTLAMVGPVVGLAPDALPQRPNIHWVGAQAYRRFPYLLAGWDLCLLPFALNDATRFISPSKALEYMAGDKPVVSTPVPDVIALYGDAVTVARAPQAFVRACESVLAEGARARCHRAMAMLNTVSVYSWERCANSVHALLTEVLARRARAASPAVVAPPPTAARARPHRAARAQWPRAWNPAGI